VVLWRKHQRVWLGSHGGLISARKQVRQAKIGLGMDKATNIPKSGPTHEIRVVDEALRINVLPRAYHHVLRRRNIDQWGFPRVGMRHPDGDGKPVGTATEANGDRARQVQKQRAGAIRES
jgi:hypothetical protein